MRYRSVIVSTATATACLSSDPNMAVLETIRNFFIPGSFPVVEKIVPAPPTTYSIHLLTIDHLADVLRLNMRCFLQGDNYTKHTFNYLLNEPRTVSYRVVAASGEIVGFAFAMVNDNGSAHLTTLGVAPEHRRRQLAQSLLDHVEKAVQLRGASTMMLEVRVGNTAAQRLYQRSGYTVVQRVEKYYTNGEDCFLMMKPIPGVW